MKAFTRTAVFSVLIFLVICISINAALVVNKKQSDNTRNLVMNRIWLEYKETADFSKETISDSGELVNHFGKKNFPDCIKFIKFDELEKFSLNSQNDKNQKYIFPITDKASGQQGFIIFEYADNSFAAQLIIINTILFVLLALIVCYALFIYKKIIKPFEELTEYPERLSRGLNTEKFPETKNKFFGKYIWGMNMLGDVLQNGRKKNLRLIKEKLTLTSTFAHGIKTPVTNIKLYSNAIQTGLYTDDINKSNIEIAKKIEKNADDIQALVTKLLDTSTQSIFEYEPVITDFYLKEIRDTIYKEYDNQFKIKKIPYSIKIKDNPILKTDKAGLLRILFQLIDNAIKYGDGTGIFIKMERQEKSFYFSIKNNGKSIEEKEIPFIFNSFWRGSHAENIEGQGIGLYEAKQIANKLGGELLVNITENAFEIILILGEK